jgi:hypothetical protein
MKKGLLFMVMVVFIGFAMSQVVATNFEDWSGGVPDGWMGDKTSINAANVTEIVGGAEYGTKVCRLEESTTSHRRFSTQNLAVTSGQSYAFTVWVKGAGSIRTGLHNGSGYQDYFNTSGVVNGYDNVTSSTDNVMLTYTHTATNSSANAQFIISIRSTVAPSHLEIDSVHIEEVTIGPPATVSLFDIQYTTAGGTAPSPLVGQLVNTGGIVMTAPFTNSSLTGFFIQDGAGAWNGILVESGEAVSPGDSITFTGLVQESFGFTIVNNLTNFEIVSSGNSLYPITPITTAQINEEQFESILVQVTDAECTDANPGFGQWEVNDGSGAALVGNSMYQYSAQVLGTEYDITGVVYYSFNEFKILPRFAADVVVANTPPPVLTSIYDIQYTTDASGDSPMLGQAVTTSGIVTAVGGDFFFLQDGAGAWNGIEIYDPSTTVSRGDSVQITGTVTEYFGVTQVHQLTNLSVISSGNTLPATTLVTTGTISEMYEGVLIRVEDVICTNNSVGFNMWQVSDVSGAINVDDKLFLYAAATGQNYNIDGIINYAFGTFRISPRDLNDIDAITSVDESIAASVRLYPNPAVTSITIEGLNQQDYVIRDVLGNQISVGQINGDVHTISLDGLKKGVYFVQTAAQTFRFVKQ